MKTTAVTVTAFLSLALSNPFVDAFTPGRLHSHATSSSWSRTSSSGLVTTAASPYQSRTSLNASSSGFLGMDDDEEDDDDEDDDDDDDDLALTSSRYSSSTTGGSSKSPFAGMTLDPSDPNPLIQPRPSRYFKEPPAVTVPDADLVQSLSTEERTENLTVMRQIQKHDLPDLRRRKDHPGWVQANRDLQRRYAKDVWFGVNERLRNAVLLGQDDATVVQPLRDLAARLGGPPPGVEISDPTKGYAVHTEIYDIGISPSRAAAILEREIRLERAARGRAMMAERQKNIEKEKLQYEEDMRHPGDRQDREAKERRERTMRRLMDEIEADNQKKAERAKEILGKVPDTPENRTKSMQKALKEARDEVKKMRRQAMGKESSSSSLDLDGSTDAGSTTSDDPASKSGADKAREALAAEASGGRPRLPGDTDVTRGDLGGGDDVVDSSTTTTGPVTVEVTSVYNADQSDPPLRKHCFQYTIRITNNSPTETIQLLGRRFEIQTVGSSMKDVVQGEGVTGRTPVLQPGEVFEYTSTAPLSVRPIGTTIIAARMRGEYRYVTLEAEQTTASDAQVEKGGDTVAELGTFHFVFPEDQRIKPFRSDTEDEDDEEDDDDEDDDDAVSAASSGSAAKASSSSSTASPPYGSPASTMPGDDDMQTGKISVPLNDSSEAVSDNVRVHVTCSYRPERSDAGLNKHCFAYNIRITNESSDHSVQLVSRRFEIQTIGSKHKDVVQGPGVTGRQPILKPGESFEYTSTAPLSVQPLLDRTPVVARMQGEYNFVSLGSDGTTPTSSTPQKAKLAMFHFILPALV